MSLPRTLPTKHTKAPLALALPCSDVRSGEDAPDNYGAGSRRMTSAPLFKLAQPGHRRRRLVDWKGTGSSPNSASCPTGFMA
jgi:hypothetical protein